MRASALAGTVEGWRSLRNRSQGTVKLFGGCGDRATALIEDIWCEKIRGCSYTGGNAVLLLNVRYAPIATGIAHAAK
jgi:hypothetical protein